MKRLIIVVLCALALISGGVFGRAVAETLPGRGLTIRTTEGTFVAYVARNGRLLLASDEGWRYAELDATLAGSLVNTLATIEPVDAVANAAFEITIDADDRRLSIADPRTALPDDALARTFVTTLWQVVDSVTTVAAVNPAIRVRLASLASSPERFFTLADGIIDLGAAIGPAGDRLTGDRLARLIVVNPEPGDGRGGGSFAVRIGERFYTLAWAPDPAAGELGPAPSAAPSPTPTLP